MDANERAQQPPEGPWRGYEEIAGSYLAGCADCLDRMRRAVAGRIELDRRGFHNDAVELREMSRQLAQLTPDVERWRGECGVTFEVGEPADRYYTWCGLPVGHPGEHAEPEWTVGERICNQARELVDRSESVSDELSLLTLRTDRTAGLGQPLDEADGTSLRDLRAKLAGIATDMSQLADGLEALERGGTTVGHTQEAATPDNPVHPARPWTENEQTETGTRIFVKRVCSGCNEPIGDVTPAEVEAAVAGLPLADVRGECPRCGPELNNTEAGTEHGLAPDGLQAKLDRLQGRQASPPGLDL